MQDPDLMKMLESIQQPTPPNSVTLRTPDGREVNLLPDPRLQLGNVTAQRDNLQQQNDILLAIVHQQYMENQAVAAELNQLRAVVDELSHHSQEGGDHASETSAASEGEQEPSTGEGGGPGGDEGASEPPTPDSEKRGHRPASRQRA